MKIESNINRNNEIHDNVNLLPIEKQIYDELVEDGFFGEVVYMPEYSKYNGNGAYDCGTYMIRLKWSHSPKGFELIYDPCFNRDEKYRSDFEYKFNEKISLDELKKTIEKNEPLFNKLKEINKWGEDNIVETNNSIIKYLDPFFINIPQIKYSINDIPSNIICRNKHSHLYIKYKDGYSKWFIIENGKIEISEIELENLFSLDYNDKKKSFSDLKEMSDTHDKLVFVLKILDFYQIPEFIEWENKKKEAIDIIHSIDSKHSRDHFLY